MQLTSSSKVLPLKGNIEQIGVFKLLANRNDPRLMVASLIGSDKTEGLMWSQKVLIMLYREDES